MCAALGIWIGTEADEAPDLSRGEGVRPVSLAAVEAAEAPGTEVAGAQVGGRDRGPRGRWALLRHRPEREDVDGASRPPASRTAARQDDATLR